MSRFRRMEILESYYPSILPREASIFTPKTLAFPSFVLEDESDDLSFSVDLLSSNPNPFEHFNRVTDLIQVEKLPAFCLYKRIPQRVETELCLQKLCDRVSVLESRFDQLFNPKIRGGDRKYTWTAEIKGPVERKYKWTEEINEGKKKKEEKKVGVEKNYKWKAEINRQGNEGPILRKYIFEATSGDGGERSGKKEKKGESSTRLVQIEECSDHGAGVLRQAFVKRAGAAKTSKGKQKELSPQDAALLIQMSFRSYLIRRSQALRALRELAIAKAKLKEIRALFNNFSYRRHVARDAEERQRFSEKIIVLLLTVDAIEGSDLMVRSAKRSIVDELEAMLDVVDPKPPGTKRRTFEISNGVI